MTTEHKDIPDAQLHEPKGVATASSGQAYIADGAGSGSWQTAGNANTGTYFYEDTTTSGSPIALTSANTQYELTNDGAGSNSVNYTVTGLTDIWNTSTSRIDLSDLSLGDQFELRVTGSFVNSGASHAMSMHLEFGVGSGSAFQVPLITKQNFKASGTFEISTYKGFFVGSTLVKNNPARLLVQSDNTGDTFIVDEFLFNVTRRV